MKQISIMCLILVLLTSICAQESKFTELQNQKPKKKQVENELIGIRKLAIHPFTDFTKKNREIAEMFADKLASQLVKSQKFDVKYPKEVIAVLLEIAEKKEYKNSDVDEYVDLGRKLGVDALIFGDIKEVDLYSPTRISFSLKMFIVESKKFANAEEVWDLSSYGVPAKYISGKDWKKFSTVWAPQNVYDTSMKDLQKRIKKYAKDRNIDDRAFGWEYFINSNDRFLEFITDEITTGLLVSVDPKYLKKSGLWYRLKYVFNKR